LDRGWSNNKGLETHKFSLVRFGTEEKVKKDVEKEEMQQQEVIEPGVK